MLSRVRCSLRAASVRNTTQVNTRKARTIRAQERDVSVLTNAPSFTATRVNNITAPVFAWQKPSLYRHYSDFKEVKETPETPETPETDIPSPTGTDAQPEVPAAEGSAATEDKPADVLIEETETVTGEAKKSEFKAETRKILDIVARSLYSEREIFIRELTSNGSDALEKVRQRQLIGQEISDPDVELKVAISVDPTTTTFTIQDTGVGMTHDELVENLGKIGHSGTAEFLKAVESNETSNLIGQFGVGFYSAFMAGEEVRVYTKSADPGSKGYFWRSDGSGEYTIAEADGVTRGTKIIVKLRPNCAEFSKKQSVEEVIKKYSNFVGFPITVNGQTVNTVQALWLMNPKQVTEEQHKDFYKFIAHAYDTPAFYFHFEIDSPLQIRSLFYFPEQHMEKYGMGKMETGVSLYSRKVLIQQKCKGLLPDWLRFVKGVVDSEDIDLNLSREFIQESAVIKRLASVLTRRILKFLGDEAKKNEERYLKWFGEFGNFLREGICTDFKWKEELAALLRMESSAEPAGTLTSLDAYVSRMKKDQKDIFFLVVPNRSDAESSPYFETFKEYGVEVLFLYTGMDDFVMNNLTEYKGMKPATIESGSAAETAQNVGAKGKEAAEAAGKEDTVDATLELDDEEFKSLSRWMKDTLDERITTVTKTFRLSSTPAIVIDHESASFRRMMRMVDQQRIPKLPKQQLQINPRHPIITNLNSLRKSDADLASEVAHQVMDNALVQAGLLDDSRPMIPRINRLMEIALKSANAGASIAPEAKAEKADPAPEVKAEKVDIEKVEENTEAKKETETKSD